MKQNDAIPGALLLKIARALLDAEDVRRVAEPAVADLQAMWRSAEPRDRRRVHATGSFEVLRAIGLAYVFARGAAIGRFPWRAATPLFVVPFASALLLRSLGLPGFARNQIAFTAASIACLAAIGSARTMAFSGSRVFAALPVLLALGCCFGAPFDGAHRWVSVGPIHLALTEFAKPILVVAMAAQLGRRAFASAALIAVGAAFAVGAEPDLPSVVAIAAATIAALGVTRAPKHVTLGAALFLIAAITIAFARTHPPSRDLHTDGVLAAIAIKAGILGVIAIVLALALIAIRVLGFARANPRSALVAGASAALVAQIVVQPLVGQGLPLVSYGGSSLVGFFALFALAARRSNPHPA